LFIDEHRIVRLRTFVGAIVCAVFAGFAGQTWRHDIRCKPASNDCNPRKSVDGNGDDLRTIQGFFVSVTTSGCSDELSYRLAMQQYKSRGLAKRPLCHSVILQRLKGGSVQGRQGLDEAQQTSEKYTNLGTAVEGRAEKSWHPWTIEASVW